jgi:hypothetical protein
MRLGIKRQLIAIAIFTAAAVAGVGLLGVHTANDIRATARTSYIDYTLALRDLAEGGGLMLSVGARMQYAHTPGVGTPADAESIDKAIAEVDTKLTAYGATTLRVSKDGRSEKADLDAFLAVWNELKATEVGLNEAFRKLATDPAASARLAELTAKIPPLSTKVGASSQGGPRSTGSTTTGTIWPTERHRPGCPGTSGGFRS